MDIKFRIWPGIGVGVFKVYYKDIIEVWLLLPLMKIRIKKTRIQY